MSEAIIASPSKRQKLNPGDNNHKILTSTKEDPTWNFITDEIIEDIAQMMTQMKHDITQIKKDNTQMKKDMTQMKQDIRPIKKDNTQIKKDNTQIKEDIAQIKEDIAQMTRIFSPHISG